MFTVRVVARAYPSASLLVDAMTARLSAHPELDIRVVPAATDVDPQAPQALLLDAELVRSADLVVASDRGRRARAARLHPPVRPCLLTVIQAAELADRTAQAVTTGQLPKGAPPLPRTADERMTWLVAELDAARGQLAGWPKDSLDLPDDGTRKAEERARTEAGRLAAALAAVASRSPA